MRWKLRILRFRLRWWWRRLQRRLDDYNITSCQRCQKLTFHKDTTLVQTTLGPWVRVCRPCRIFLYGENDTDE